MENPEIKNIKEVHDKEFSENEQVVSSDISATDILNKRKNYDNLAVSKQKKHLPDLKKDQSVCESSEGCLNTRKRKKKQNSQYKKKKCFVDEAEVKSDVLKRIDDEIDNVLEETASKIRLTVPNVKSILRHVITNEYVLAMVRNTMKAENNNLEDLEEIPFEPKLTRSKVKELKEKQHMLPWPVSTPSKQVESETQALLEGEFSDESSSDEDYKPNEEECPSEEEVIEGSPETSNSNSNVCELIESPASKYEEFEEPRLVIAVPEPEPEPESLSFDNEVDNIALRTRSKLPLNNTPIEAIEASLVAPDITVDMYDTNCDNEEWLKFIKELSGPLDSFTAVEKPDEEPDDPEEDPEYNALEDDDVPDELDFRFDRISRKELNALMAEIYDESFSIYDESFFNDNDEDEEQEILERPEKFIQEDISFSKDVPDVEDLQIHQDVQTNQDVQTHQDVQTERSGWGMLPEERLQLEHQMRMVQCSLSPKMKMKGSL